MAPVQLTTFIRRGGHGWAIVMARRALGARDQLERLHAAMFLMTNRTGAILDDIRLVKVVGALVPLEMASLTVFIDRCKSEAAMKSIAKRVLEVDRSEPTTAAGEGVGMTTGAVIDQGGMTPRQFPRIKKLFVATALKSDDGCDPGRNNKQVDEEPCRSPEMRAPVITKVAAVFLRNLLLRSSGCRHCVSVVEEGDDGMPAGEQNEKERERHMDEEPGVEPVMKLALQIQRPPLLTPALNFLYPTAIGIGDT